MERAADETGDVQTKQRDFPVTERKVSEVIWEIKLEENDLLAILKEKFKTLGDNMEMEIHCRQGFFDGIHLSVRCYGVEVKEIKLSDLSK